MSNVVGAELAAQELRLRRCTEMDPVYFHGETMRPFLAEGDHVVVRPVSWCDIQVGDVITYRFEDKFPTRRVVEINAEGDRLILRGDSIPGRPDYVVDRADVLGRAEVRLRDGIKVTRASDEWRRATRRALTLERTARAVVSLPWPWRGLIGRLVPRLRFG